MEQILVLMMGAGVMLFLCFGLCGNSIEAKESKIVGSILAGLTFLAALSAIVGFIGLIFVKLCQ